ncbi:MAG: transcriptional regulator, PadR-family [Gemmatimonadetes bacterium]|jgi:PadR family transcriptional regulator PadR|nr:transcriptional regulator, PadR-family [Gemmatimonadota bacterium]
MAASDLDLVRGTLDLLILKTLSWGPMHGLAVVRWIEQTTHEQLQIEEGALYPALHRMEEKGWLDAEWGYTERNRKAKFYRLSTRGRKQLASELSRWSRYTSVVGLVIAARGAGAR